VAGLIDSELAASREAYSRAQTPPKVFNGSTRETALGHRSHDRLDVVTHQIELVYVVVIGRGTASSADGAGVAGVAGELSSLECQLMAQRLGFQEQEN